MEKSVSDTLGMSVMSTPAPEWWCSYFDIVGGVTGGGVTSGGVTSGGVTDRLRPVWGYWEAARTWHSPAGGILDISGMDQLAVHKNKALTSMIKKYSQI